MVVYGGGILMKKIFGWICRHKVLTFLVVVALFFIPLIMVHFLFKWNSSLSWISSEWSAGDVLGYIAGFEAFLGTVALGALALWQNQQIHKQHIESLEPSLSMKLIEINHILYLAIENVGSTEAREIKIIVNSIKNNGGSDDMILDGLFDCEFELFPTETVQGQIAISGADIATEIFPQINITVSYIRPDLNRKKTYSRTVIYNNGFAKRVVTDVNVDNCKIEDNVESLAYSIVRIANYMEGRTLFKFDKLNVMAKSSFAEDILKAIQSIKETQEEPNNNQ